MNISVIIPNYNYARYISIAIESVLNQSLKPIEIIVVDDGSTDDSVAIAKKYPVRVIEQPNAGVSAARNTGIKASKGDVFAFLDSDDVWLKEKLERQAELLTDEVGLVLSGLGNEQGVQHHVARTPEDVLLGVPTTFMGSSFMVRREIAEKVMFTEGRTVSEDWEFGFRCSTLTKMDAIGPLTYYRQHGKGAHLNLRSMEANMLDLYDSILIDFPEIRKASYAYLHRMLAGSYFWNGSLRVIPNYLAYRYYSVSPYSPKT